MTTFFVVLYALTVLAYVWADKKARDAKVIVHPEFAAITDAAFSYVVSRFLLLCLVGVGVASVA